jgi:hypothetical protein
MSNMHCLTSGPGPKKPTRPPAYSEGENESPRLVDEEPTEIEREVPETDSQPVERDVSDAGEPPIFEE